MKGLTAAPSAGGREADSAGNMACAPDINLATRHRLGERTSLHCAVRQPTFPFVKARAIQSPNFQTLKGARNRFKGINSAGLCSLAGRYGNLFLLGS